VTTGRKPEMLCVGRDPLLNGTRRLVLEKYFEVDLAQRVPEACLLLKAKPFDLVLLCYSLSDEECRVAIECIDGLPARPKILALAQGHQRLLLQAGDEEFAPNGPAELLAKAAAMVNLPPKEQLP
jgi:DNA-binding response OmpR family regulator